MENPEEVINAVTDAKPLSLAQIAVLEKAECPVLRFEIDKIADNIRAAYLYATAKKSVRDAVAAIADAEAASLEWVDGLKDGEFKAIFTELLEGLDAFYQMLPPPKKKTMETEGNTETDGS